MEDKSYPCDYPPHECPYDAYKFSDCEYHCGLGVPDEPYPWEDCYVEEDYDVEEIMK